MPIRDGHKPPRCRSLEVGREVKFFDQLGLLHLPGRRGTTRQTLQVHRRHGRLWSKIVLDQDRLNPKLCSSPVHVFPSWAYSVVNLRIVFLAHKLL
jgi:hypothetical protein